MEKQNIVQKFMDLFLLEQVDGIELDKQVYSSNTGEAVQIALEPYAYLPLIEQMQKYAEEKVGVGQSEKFRQEINEYIDYVSMECPGKKALKWSKKEIMEKQKNYSFFDREGMRDFIVVEKSICEYLDDRENTIKSGMSK